MTPDPVRVRVGVIGVGHLGRQHARILADLTGASLVAVADLDRARAEEAAAALGVAGRAGRVSAHVAQEP
jgi:predicted dehydrogenase